MYVPWSLQHSLRVMRVRPSAAACYAAGVQPKPFKLSLCGATALTHDAVSALLRLPMLSDLKIDGCYRITSMDKMRLVAKVKAGASFGAPASARSAARGCGAPAKPMAYAGNFLRAAA